MSPAALAPLMWGLMGLVAVFVARWSSLKYWDADHPLRMSQHAAA